ncbi:hypothetical protein ACIPJ1_14490 [Microbacterium maritypicum]|uniref:hypothetical protein n=1 Tax=Microbacterium TaxID=33882 RepID=UPI0004938D9F|nr:MULTISPECIES: hypothetical protein [unclassified Microbacterium]MCV0335821.1 hypothetical protein [Microbacterium sp.]MCV0376799.1 hypothetical protein [Microbacterium sp.]MCV0391548.1 hypothetical protein [Microbacterium sp.]MCV0419951.1 hypothetical protein [Microbacterium sp.]MCV0423675.1 hypothetical protein [Microbacterium sp.]
MTTTTVTPDSRIDEELDELPVLDRGDLRCECNHGTGDDYRACGDKARWRVTIVCTCGGGHPRRVELLCTQCLANRRRDLERESITIRPV